MQTTPQDIRALCITRLKSPDFALSRPRRSKLPTLIGISLIGLIITAYLIATLLLGGAS